MGQKELQIKKGRLFPTGVFNNVFSKNQQPQIIENTIPLKSDMKMEKELFNAIKENNVKKIKLLISKGVDLNAKCENEFTPLMDSILSSTKEITRTILNNNVDVNAQNKFGNTALHYIYYKDYEILELILIKGGDINIRNNENKTPIMEMLYHSINMKGEFIEKDSLSKISLLFEKLIDSNYEQKLHHAIELLTINPVPNTEVYSRIMNIIKTTSHQNNNINVKNKEGDTPILLVAKANICTSDKIELIKLFVENGAKVLFKDNNGKEAIDYIHHDYKELINLLSTLRWLEKRNLIKTNF